MNITIGEMIGEVEKNHETIWSVLKAGIKEAYKANKNFIFIPKEKEFK